MHKWYIYLHSALKIEATVKLQSREKAGATSRLILDQLSAKKMKKIFVKDSNKTWTFIES
jgi:hypothetical protein